MYISQDPIGLMGNNPTLYSYVKNTNKYIDRFGLSLEKGDVLPNDTKLFRIGGSDVENLKLKPAEVDLDPETGTSTMQLVKTQTHIDSFPHKGSAGQFADHFGVKYDTKEAVDISKSKGWHPSCK